MLCAKVVSSLLIVAALAVCQFPAQVSLQPVSAAAGSPEITITVSGQEFSPDMVVLWNGERRETNYIYSGALSVRITAADIERPTLAAVSVWDTAGQRQFGETAYFLVYLELWNDDLVWDPARLRLYVSVPGRQGAEGKSIVAINPETGVIEQRFPLGAEPEALAISDDTRYLYVGTLGLVRRINLNTWTSDLDIPLGVDEFGAPNRPASLLVLAGRNDSIVTSFRRPDFSSPSYSGTAVFDGAVRRPKQLSPFSAGPEQLSGGPDAFTVYGGPGRIVALRIDPEGVQVEQSVLTVYTDSGPVIYDRGFLYSSWGLVFDASRLSVIDRFPAGGLIRPIPEINRTLILGGDYPPGYVFSPPPALLVFDHTTKERLATFPLPVNLARTSGRLIYWGDGGIAFSDASPYREPTNRLYIFRVPGLAIQQR